MRQDTNKHVIKVLYLTGQSKHTEEKPDIPDPEVKRLTFYSIKK